MFMQPGSVSNAFDVWVGHKLGGFSTIFTSTEARQDAFGLSAGADARLGLLDLRTMKLVAIDNPSIPALIQRCSQL